MVNSKIPMYYKKVKFTGFSGYNTAYSSVIRPERFKDVIGAMKNPPDRHILARGAGKSYGDAALNSEGAILLTGRLNRLLSFSDETGILRAESGVTIKDILTVFVPRGWVLPVVPGISSITLGGCIAFDIHSKNHWKEGSFHDHVNKMSLVLADGSICECSRNKEPDLFWATVGGMGLTGIIVEVELKLRRIEVPCFKAYSIPVHNLEDTLCRFDEACASHDFAVAWIDLLNKNMFGRGILFAADYATSRDIIDSGIKDAFFYDNNLIARLPLKPLAPFFNRVTNRMFNLLFYQKHAKTASRPYFVGLQPFLCPWDSIPNWNQLYGSRGFVEYQCVLPIGNALQGLESIFEQIRMHFADYPVYFAVIKRMGYSPAPMSYPLDGYSILMDFPLRQGLQEFLNEIDQIVIRNSGKVFLAKDGRISAAAFQKMYTNLEWWLKIKNVVDPQELFSSDMSRRLLLTKR